MRRPLPPSQRTATSLCLEFLMICLILLAGLWAVGSALSPRTLNFEGQPRVPHRGGVASLDARCSHVGGKILQKAGNAADAVGDIFEPLLGDADQLTNEFVKMIATQLCLGVIGSNTTTQGRIVLIVPRNALDWYRRWWIHANQEFKWVFRIC